MIDFELIENKHKKIIDKAKAYMLSINDYEHDIHHAEDVVYFCKQLLSEMDTKDIDCECVIICAYWHDVGRTKCAEGHELISAKMLYKELIDDGYKKDFAEKCFACVEHHRYDMTPTIIEGHILKDSDKLGFLGEGRWKSCLDNNYPLDDIVSLIPRLKNELFYFEQSKEIYDKQILKILDMLYKRIRK